MNINDKEIAKLIERQKVYAKLVKIDELLNEAQELAFDVKNSFHHTSMASRFGNDIYEKLGPVVEEADNASNQAFCQKTFCDKR